MNEFERLLMEEVRKHEHLYDCFSPHYKDFEMAAKSWNEISLNMGEHVSECTKRWKNLRDKYVRVRKRLTASDPETRERKLRVPAFYTQLSWLAPHVKHRNRDSVDGDNEEDSNQVETPVEPSPPSPDLRVAPAQKRKRQELEDRLQQQVARLEERRAQLQQQRTTLRDNDELSRFGQTVADMLRRLPEEFRPEAMFDVHKLYLKENLLMVTVTGSQHYVCPFILFHRSTMMGHNVLVALQWKNFVEGVKKSH